MSPRGNGRRRLGRAASPAQPSGTGSWAEPLDPFLHPGVFVFCELPEEPPPPALGEVVGFFREEEGLTVILPEGAAARLGWVPLYRAAWIELRIDSSLAEVGLTRAVAIALARAGISCNVVAASRHDHLFVAVDRAEEALAILAALPGNEP